jgi:hypothetical protein
MATRKTTDDLTARQHVKGVVDGRSFGSDDTSDVIDLFETVEFETAASRVGGTEITLRRVVLTGPWEVVTK